MALLASVSTGDLVWQQWLLAAFFALGAVVTITQVGKARKPTEPGVAAAIVVIDVLLIWCAVSF